MKLHSSVPLSSLITFCPVVFNIITAFHSAQALSTPHLQVSYGFLAWNTFPYLSSIHLLTQTCLIRAAERAESNSADLEA